MYSCNLHFPLAHGWHLSLQGLPACPHAAAACTHIPLSFSASNVCCPPATHCLPADVTGLDTYIHNMKYNVQGVVFAPRTAIRNTVVEVASAVGHVNVFTVAPLARGTLLENVYARSYM